MTRNTEEWNPCAPSSWAQELGLVHVPLFGASQRPWPGSCAALLDGDKSSLAIFVAEDDGHQYDDRPVSWSWSAHLRHTLVVNQKKSEMFLRRWDSPEYRRYALPERPSQAEAMLTYLEQTGAPRATDVVLHVLRAFRQLREMLPPECGLDAVRVFNAILAGAESVGLGRIDLTEWLGFRTVEQEMARLDPDVAVDTGILDASSAARRLQIAGLLEFIVQPAPSSGLQLEPDLLLRHASGHLYQEAHILIERESRSLALPGMGGFDQPAGVLKRDVRFTPLGLARWLVQQSFDALGSQLAAQESLTILDPACGSGVFLQESLRELQQKAFTHPVALIGYDISPISCAMARFCLGKAVRETQASGMRVSVCITEADALQVDWGRPTIVVMNPPFVSWESMSPSERATTSQTLGSLAKGRVDKAMAFVWKAAGCLAPGGVVASILPAALLETRGGQEWREAISQLCHPHALGHFRGYGYFRHSMVEPAITVLRRRTSCAPTGGESTKMVISAEGSEDSAIRAWRKWRGESPVSRESRYEVFTTPTETLTPASWLPRTRRHQLLVEHLTAQQVPTVGQLFHVRLGARTGRKKVFVLSRAELSKLKRSERQYFRPIAGSAQIRDGRVVSDHFTFYPYNENGPLFRSEEELRDAMPEFFRMRLRPFKDELRRRSEVDEQQWWGLARGRTWQWERRPKIVSNSFGEMGSFAYDAEGDFVVIQGHAWEWRRADNNRLVFHRSPLPWAYLALLNSPVFEALLSHYCPRVQGGQFDLSKRFVDNAFIADLSDELRIPGETVHELSHLGQLIDHGQMPGEKVLAVAAARAYGLPGADVEALVDTT